MYGPEDAPRRSSYFFKQLFCAKEGVGGVHTYGNIHPLSADGRRALTRHVSKEEVHRAIMSMKSYKAPGPNGFQPIFYKKFWEVVGDDVWHFVRDSFMFGQFTHPVSDTLMVLIPKVDDPGTFKDFCPISLYNVLYKIVTKILVNRLQPFLNDMVSPLQSSFIPGRGTVDNAIVLQEVVHYMKKSKKKKGDMVLKLDLEEAYDRVD